MPGKGPQKSYECVPESDQGRLDLAHILLASSYIRKTKNAIDMRILVTALALTSLLACGPNPADPILTVASPDGQLAITFLLDEGGRAAYRVERGDQVVLDTSFLGFDLKDQPPLGAGLQVTASNTGSFSETWRPVWGEDSEILNQYHSLLVELEETGAPGRKFEVEFRVYDDGFGFRYLFPEQEGLQEVVIMDENTEFALTGDHLCWWQPGDWDIYEHLYQTTRFSEIDALALRNQPIAQTYIPENAVNTPVTMKTDSGLYLAFHEAALYDYAGMTLKVDKENLKWVSELVGAADGSKVTTRTPFHTPWRTVQIAERAGDLIESHLIVNLNEPNKLENTAWIKPTKYIGIWWEMHLEKAAWDLASGKHGATTENAKRYIDFAAANGIPAFLVEGWNNGWEKWREGQREGIFDFVTPYADFDLAGVVEYGRERGVSLIGHHETAGAVSTYEQQMDTAFQLYQDLGIHAVKTGYVGTIIPSGHYHHGQYMVNHFQEVVEKAAQYQIMVNAHEPIKDTGIRRTWPNFMAREAMRGQEFNAFWPGGNPPEHTVLLAFTRMLAGPLDFTPGIFDLKFPKYRGANQVNTTLAKQLALYVVLYGPLQMAADLPENYEGNPAFQFIRDVPVDWHESHVLNGEVGDFVTIVRKGKGTDDWYLGSITDENARQLEVELDFLDDDRAYTATIYADAPDAHWNDNPTAYVITQEPVKKGEKLRLDLAAGGGVAIRFAPTN